MTYKVGSKGQIVIEKEIRDRLGVQPGWQAIQLLVDNHVELYFVPPEHDRSLAGSLSDYVGRCFPTDEELETAIDEAWTEEVREKYGP